MNKLTHLKMNLSKHFFKILFVGTVLFVGLNTNLPAQNLNDSPEKIVDKLYDLVTFEKGNSPDWNAVKALFLDDAVIVLRTTYTQTQVFDLNGFVDEFVNFIENAKVTETGFSETIIKKHSVIFGDIASFLVLYEAQITGSAKKTVGVDHFSLIKKDGIWKIVSITNELPTAERPIPKELAD